MLPKGPLSGCWLITARWAYAGAMVAAFLVAISPLAVKSTVDQADKVAHILAFYGLTLCAVIAFPRGNLALIAVGMSFYGALIEVAQGLPGINRDRDVWDWVADSAASIAALLPLVVARWRPPR